MRLINESKGELVYSTEAAPVSPIGYRQKADALLKMWMDDELTDGEYYKIMDRLNKIEKHER